MPTKSDDKTTEERILKAAEKVFYENGYNGARMQAIADEANINKALLHYYFRSKDKLFRMILITAFGQMMPRQMMILSQDKGVMEKIRDLVQFLVPVMIEKPHLPVFIIYEMTQRQSDFLLEIKSNFVQETFIRNFFQQIQREMDAGKIKPMDPMDLYMNVMSMIIFPFVSKAFISTVMNLDESAFIALMENRVESIYTFIQEAVEV